MFSNPLQCVALSGKPPKSSSQTYLTGLADSKSGPHRFCAVLLPQPILKVAQNGLEQARTPYPT